MNNNHKTLKLLQRYSFDTVTWTPLALAIDRVEGHLDEGSVIVDETVFILHNKNLMNYVNMSTLSSLNDKICSEFETRLLSMRGNFLLHLSCLQV